MISYIRTPKEGKDYSIKIVDRLPKKGNARFLYVLNEDFIEAFYRWDTSKTEFKKVSVTNTNLEITTLNISTISVYENEAEAITGGLLIGDIYSTSTGELRIKL